MTGAQREWESECGGLQTEPWALGQEPLFLSRAVNSHLQGAFGVSFHLHINLVVQGKL